MKKCERIFLPLIFFGILIIPTLCCAEIYVGAYLGGNFVGDIDPNFRYYVRHGPTPGDKHVDVTRTPKNVSVSPAFTFGGKIGYWFNRESYLGLKSPNWLKYLGFEIDVNWHRFDWPKQTVTVSPLNSEFVIKSDAWALTASFLFMFRYGFLPDQEVPIGRLQPYLGIGPMIFVANTSMNFWPPPQHTRIQNPEADLGLTVEPGIRYMVWKHASVNFAFRFRYVHSHFGTDDSIFDMPHRWVVVRTRYHLYGIILGMAYHF